MAGKEMAETAGLLGEVAHPGRPKDEEPHIKRSIKKKQEVIDYLVRVNLEELGIDESSFEVERLFRWVPSLSRSCKRCSECLTTTRTGFFPSRNLRKCWLCWGDQVSLHQSNSARELGGC